MFLSGSMAFRYFLKIYRVDATLTFTPQTVYFPGTLMINSFYFSNSGKRIVYNMIDGGSTQVPSPWHSRLYDFNLATGELSNPIQLWNTGPTYENEFSPDDSKLYMCSSGRITQYDLSLTTEVAIQIQLRSWSRMYTIHGPECEQARTGSCISILALV